MVTTTTHCARGLKIADNAFRSIGPNFRHHFCGGSFKGLRKLGSVGRLRRRRAPAAYRVSTATIQKAVRSRAQPKAGGRLRRKLPLHKRLLSITGKMKPPAQLQSAQAHSLEGSRQCSSRRVLCNARIPTTSFVLPAQRRGSDDDCGCRRHRSKRQNCALSRGYPSLRFHPAIHYCSVCGCGFGFQVKIERQAQGHAHPTCADDN